MTKTLQEWEKGKGFIIRSLEFQDESGKTVKLSLNQKMTEKEFDSLPFSIKHGVNYADRVQFLRANGYEVTRENMVADLSAKGAKAV